MSDSNLIAMRQKLLTWFNANARELPWRMPAPRNPYVVAVSEVMLQQTQVATVLKYWNRWMTDFPTWQALAEAPVDRVLKAWEGMGYYSRARNLKKLAESVAATTAGLPCEPKELEKLPGIGPYSSRSIASIAFGRPHACVDGNIVRVLSRVYAIDKTYKSASAAAQDFQELADKFLNTAHPGEHNEAMMELGATICTKAAPKCPVCPLREHCEAYKRGIMEELPRLEKVKIIPKQVRRIWAVRDGKLLLHYEGAATGELKGLWELPTPEAAGVKRLPTKETLRRVRSITKYKITESIFSITETDGIATRVKNDERMRWVSFAELEKIPLSGPHALWIKELLSRKRLP